MALLRKKAPTSRRRSASGQAPARKNFSYNRSGSGQPPEQQRDPRASLRKPAVFKYFWAQRFGLIILVTVIAVCAVNVLTLSPHAKLLPVTDAGGNSFLRESSVYQAAADKILADSIWNRNKITISNTDFSRKMTKQFPELSGASLAVPLLAHRPVVYLQPAQPALVLASDTGSFVIDNRGKALLPADGASHNKLPQVVDQSGLQVKLNERVLSSSNVAFIQTVVAQLAARKVSVSSLVLPASTSEVDARIAGQTYFVKFNMQENNPRQQAGTYLATLAYLQRKHTAPGKYIDVRVPGRAYYQ